MLKKEGFVRPSQWQFPIDTSVDYRLPENRLYMVMAWAEAMYHTGELNQQLRLMDWAIDHDSFPGYDKMESKLWLAFLWGCCYNLTGPWVILNAFPVPPKLEEIDTKFSEWYNHNFDNLRFDTDCRYRKANMIACVKSYVKWLNGRSQQTKVLKELEESFSSPQTAYHRMWSHATNWDFYGRLSSWNYLEAVALVTGWNYPFDCQSFLLTDVTGSESNRNGVAFMIDREDLLTKHGKLKSTGVAISQSDCEMLEIEGEKIFGYIKKNLNHIDPVLRFNVETIMCWTKKRFRDYNTRYLGWDSERTYDEIEYTRKNWCYIPVKILYEARKAWLPEYIRCEDAPVGVVQGVDKRKMPVFFETGTPWDIIHFQRGERWVVEKEKLKSNSKRLW